jgi:hypothetical protein
MFKNFPIFLLLVKIIRYSAKKNLPEKICITCDRPFTRRKNGSVFGMKLSPVQINVEKKL